MLSFRTGLAAIATATLLAGATPAMAEQDSAGATHSGQREISGTTRLQTAVDLPAGSTWTDVLNVRLPAAGMYELDANVRGRLQGTPRINAYITARLWNGTSSSEVPQSERLVYQIVDFNTGAAPAGGNATAPLSELVRVTRPTTIELQAQHIDSAGTATIAQIASDSAGFTSLRYHQISTATR